MTLSTVSAKACIERGTAAMDFLGVFVDLQNEIWDVWDVWDFWVVLDCRKVAAFNAT